MEIRLSQTHDLRHVLTGFDTSLHGEIGLQAFYLGQFPYPLGAMPKVQALQEWAAAETPAAVPAAMGVGEARWGVMALKMLARRG